MNTTLDSGAYTVWWVIFNNPEFCVDSCDVGDLEISEVNASAFWATGGIVKRDLLKLYGQAYADYRRRVPMLIPFSRRPLEQ